MYEAYSIKIEQPYKKSKKLRKHEEILKVSLSHHQTSQKLDQKEAMGYYQEKSREKEIPRILSTYEGLRCVFSML